MRTTTTPWQRCRAALVLVVTLALGSLVAASPAQASAPTLEAPWDAGKTFTVGNGAGGGYYGHCCGMTPDLDLYSVDINGPGGANADCGENVRATAAGTVNAVGTYSSGGIDYIRIDHGGGYTSEYQHVTNRVLLGSVVAQGDIIAKFGNVGTVSCHLHFVVKLSGTSVPPSPLSGTTLPATYGTNVTSTNSGTVAVVPSAQKISAVFDSGIGTTFARGSSGSLLTWWQSTAGGSWNGPAALVPSVPMTNSPAAIVGPTGIYSVFARGAGGDLITYWQSSGTWYAASLGGSITESPAVVQDSSGSLTVFARSTTGTLLTWWQSSGGTWNGPATLAGTVTFNGTPSAYLDPTSGVASVYARGSGGNLVTYYQASAGSSTWNAVGLGGSISDSPSAVFTSSGAGTVVARGSGGDLQIWWQSSAGSTWSGPLSLGGSIAGSPAAVMYGNAASAYVRSTSGAINTWWQSSPGSSWSGPAGITGSTSGSPGVTMSSGGLGTIFNRGPGGDLQIWWQPTVGSTWSGPLSLGGSLG